MTPQFESIILLFSIEHFDRRTVENLTGLLVNKDQFLNEVVIDNIPPNEMPSDEDFGFERFYLSDFCEACNNQEIELDNYWMATLTIENHLKQTDDKMLYLRRF